MIGSDAPRDGRPMQHEKAMIVQMMGGVFTGRTFVAGLSLHALDVRAQAVEFFVDQFIAAVDVIDAVDFRDAL